MAENKFNFRNEIRFENQLAREERARKGWKRNNIGLLVSALLFFCILLATMNGFRLHGNLSMLVIIASLMGVFYFGRELRVLPKGQLVFSGIKALLCLGMGATYAVMHRGLWDVMDFSILAVFLLVVLMDLPRVSKAWKQLKGEEV